MINAMDMTKKYVSREIVVEALQWTGENHRAMWNFLTGKVDEPIYPLWKSFYIDHDEVEGGLVIVTQRGVELKANIGDYIIKNKEGDFIPESPDVFKEKYVEF